MYDFLLLRSRFGEMFSIKKIYVKVFNTFIRTIKRVQNTCQRIFTLRQKSNALNENT